MTYTEMTNYINTRIIYMNFKIDNDGDIWGLQEGSRQQPLVPFNKFIEYGKFLNDSIQLLEGHKTFLSATEEKLLKKFKLYLKRYNTAKTKLEALQPISNIIENTINKMINEGLDVKIDGELLSFDKGLECFIDSEFTYSNGEMYEILEQHFNGHEATLKQYNDFEEHGLVN